MLFRLMILFTALSAFAQDEICHRPSCYSNEVQVTLGTENNLGIGTAQVEFQTRVNPADAFFLMFREDIPKATSIDCEGEAFFVRKWIPGTQEERVSFAESFSFSGLSSINNSGFLNPKNDDYITESVTLQRLACRVSPLKKEDFENACVARYNGTLPYFINSKSEQNEFIALLKQLIKENPSDPVSACAAARASLKSITKLEVTVESGVWLTGLASLFPELRELKLRGNVEDLYFVSAFQKLNSLDLSGTSLKSLTTIPYLKALTDLDVSETMISSLEGVGLFSNLRSLDISGTRVTSLEPLSTMKSLFSISLNGTEVKDLSPLTGHKYLRVLRARNTKASDLTSVETLKNLSAIDVSGSAVRDISPLAKLSFIRDLRIQNTQVRDVRPLVLNPQLVSLQCEGSAELDPTYFAEFLKSRKAKYSHKLRLAASPEFIEELKRQLGTTLLELIEL